MLLAGGGITWFLLRRLPCGEQVSDKLPVRLIVAVAILIWVVPAIPIAASFKYQRWIRHVGVGYLPVYLQYAGVAMLGVPVIAWCSTHWPRGRTSLAAALIAANACIACITFDTNRRVIYVSQVGSECDSRRNMEQALKAGVANEVPDGATIMTTNWHPWLFDGPPATSHFFTQCTHRKLHAGIWPLGPRASVPWHNN